ncbi:hypothetical protein [Sporosarcina ureilytica]|uniref:Uncharacterized protein n=1 Tax=Sporosarcina ureilytica TaxID=298596 RepID=A0A1D8JJJ5_9BACL|nr:hypothetical protein [Sporosarcina ureilytica]AOV08888.1 hypothetical protein BI350_15920 [Sporosarcina ureilytica]
MSNMQMREKLRNIATAAKNGEQIPEHSKRFGMFIFYLFATIGVLAIIVFAIVLFIHDHPIGALMTIAIALAIIYILYKIKSADEISID